MRALLLACALVAVGVGVKSPVARAADVLRGDQETGYLDVSSDPPARVHIDDVDTGKTTPAPHLPLKAGHHKLTLVTADGAHKRTIGFTVEAGQTTKLSIHLTS
jgi:PEGA domain